MNKTVEIPLKAARRLCMAFQKKKTSPSCDADSASSSIYKLLSGDGPCMIARFGSTEMNVLQNYLAVKNRPGLLPYLKGDSYQWWWSEKGLYELINNSGFFPNDIASTERFCEMMLNDAKEVDFLGSWLQNEEQICPQLGAKDKAPLRFLEPFWSEFPWTKALEGKKVLIIHPFAELIEQQYNTKRSKLFASPSILPEFHLTTIKAVQSLGGECDAFSSWFEALEWMEKEVEKTDFDIALIGCGSYGFPLAAHIKRIGKKAFHMGGALQLLFGIKGARWEDPMYGVREWGIPMGFYRALMNDYWVKAGTEFRPQNADKVENACYW